jgi:type I restriction enzyme R subunit
MHKYLAESDIETAAIEWLLQDKRFQYHHGQDIPRNFKKTVLEEVFSNYLNTRYQHIPAKILAEVQQEFLYQAGADLHLRNHNFHLKLSKGFPKTWKDANGKDCFEHFYAVNYDEVSKNEFWVVNQFSIEGRNNRRPDLIIFVNGLPLVLFEFKNWFDPEATVDSAFNQIQHYTEDIPLVFETNCLTVVSDGQNTLHGMYSSGMEWYAAWKSIDGIKIVENDFALETLIKGLLTPERLLAYIRYYIFHETDKGVLLKKGAKYHQFFGIQFALEQTLKSIRPIGDGRIGVIWHTTRSGKSITMAIYAGILRQMSALKNPTIILQVDRFDLNKQLYEDFIAAKDLVGDVQLAQTTEELRNLISGDGGGVIFSTIEKFRLRNLPSPDPSQE